MPMELRLIKFTRGRSEGTLPKSRSFGALRLHALVKSLAIFEYFAFQPIICQILNSEVEIKLVVTFLKFSFLFFYSKVFDCVRGLFVEWRIRRVHAIHEC